MALLIDFGIFSLAFRSHHRCCGVRAIPSNLLHTMFHSMEQQASHRPRVSAIATSACSYPCFILCAWPTSLVTVHYSVEKLLDTLLFSGKLAEHLLHGRLSSLNFLCLFMFILIRIFLRPTLQRQNLLSHVQRTI